jgi:hypothetical protein
MEVIIVFAKLCEKLIVEEVKLVLFMNGKVSLQVFKIIGNLRIWEMTHFM